MKSPHHFDLIRASLAYIREHFAEQPDLDQLAAHANLSKYHFQRLFQDWAGVSPKQFLQHTTAQHARKLLLNGESTLTTAWEVGLSGTGRLHDLFVKIEACTPGEFKSRGKGLSINWTVIRTYFGLAMVAETERGIAQFGFIDAGEDPKSFLNEQYPMAELLERKGPHARKLEAYMKDFVVPEEKIPLDLKGTPFQVKVWEALLRIPSGRLCAYKDIAEAIGKPTASRAVGTAIGRNPIAYLIPCHRVIRENGQFSGYRWQPDRKTAMIGWESVRFNVAAVRDRC
ncbi:MAG: methylated-DNA--[protein]-cysteine S-methyltransferase [Bacteroidota bacterium]